jgi:hypothetical protein
MDQRTDDESQVVYYTQATVRAAAADGTSSEDLLKLIKKRAVDPTIFSEEGAQPFTWQAQVSSSKLDTYFTRQDTQSLQNYARDATDGVMFLDSHDKHQLGFGQSFRGIYTPANNNIDPKAPDDKDPAMVDVDFYTVPGLSLGRADSDSFIKGVRSGVIRDVSIGFMPDRFECNICGNDPFDWWSMDCLHIPGAYYDASGKTIVKKSNNATQAFAWVRDSRLLEVSAVYDGASPGAYIKKAQFLAQAGEVTRSAATIIERQLRIRLPEKAMLTPVLKIEHGQGTDKLVLARGTAVIDGVEYHEGMEVKQMAFRRLSSRSVEDPEPATTDGGEDTTETTPSPPPENTNLKREESPEGVASTSGGITSATHAAPEDLRMTGLNEQQVRELQERARATDEMINRTRNTLGMLGVKDAETVDIEEVVRGAYQRIHELEPLAKLGNEWRDHVVSEALAAGVVAEGNSFDRDGWAETFSHMTIAQVERVAKTWEGKAPNVGGRRTSDVGTESPGAARPAAPTAPVAQYSLNGRRH